MATSAGDPGVAFSAEHADETDHPLPKLEPEPACNRCGDAGAILHGYWDGEDTGWQVHEEPCGCGAIPG